VVYVYDVTQPATLDSLADKWMADYKQYGRPDAVQMVVGNKIDLVRRELLLLLLAGVGRPWSRGPRAAACCSISRPAATSTRCQRCCMVLHCGTTRAPHHQGEAARAVSPDEGAAFAREHGCLYKETSAKTDSGGTDEGVYDALVWGERLCVCVRACACVRVCGCVQWALLVVLTRVWPCAGAHVHGRHTLPALLHAARPAAAAARQCL
jgi:hypothetical protein